MTGIAVVSGSAFSRVVASNPSIAGILMSIRITSGFHSRASAIPSRADDAPFTSNPRRDKRRVMNSMLFGSSSTYRIFGIGLLRGVLGGGLADPAEDGFDRQRPALLNHLSDAAVESANVVGRQV